ncbi:hypothetical protein OS493_036353 [Desmophyllum pertusum]|uniref:Uncharacterized protein n=1 Tax=Desmophyllum pertusum TaxID=174260 RepID=A0A9X0CHX7_9CNID|nr:hypothetical protein OS493_036353 [Desmophyllum pertusum]
MDDISYLLVAVNDVLTVLDRFENTNNGERDLQLLLSKLDYLQRIAVNLDMDDFLSEMFGRAHSLMLEIERANQQSIGYRACAQGDERRGRPSFHITEEQLSFFIEQGFKVKDISSMLNVSVRTVERRMAAFGQTFLTENHPYPN